MSLQPQTFHPQLDALFDDAQKTGVAVDFEGRSFVLLSKTSFQTMLEATNTNAAAVRHLAVPRVDKPITYIVSREAFDELVEIHEMLRDLIKSDVRIHCPN